LERYKKPPLSFVGLIYLGTLFNQADLKVAVKQLIITEEVAHAYKAFHRESYIHSKMRVSGKEFPFYLLKFGFFFF